VALQAIAKFGLPRVVMVQQPVLRSVELYRRTERSALVLRSQRALLRRRAELFVVDRSGSSVLHTLTPLGAELLRSGGAGAPRRAGPAGPSGRREYVPPAEPRPCT